MISWLCHELLWSSRDSQHPTPGPVTRLCCRAEKKGFRNLRQYFPLFASLHDNNQIPSLWVISRPRTVRVSVRRGTNLIILVKMSQDQDDERLCPCDDDASSPIEIIERCSDIDQSEEWRYESLCPVNKLSEKERERCSPLVDWFNTRVSRGAKLRGELVPRLLCAQTLHLTHQTWERGAESPLSCHQHKSHVSLSPESHTAATQSQCVDLLSNV